MNPEEYEIADGYVGCFGITYKPATPETLSEAIEMAAKRHGLSVTKIEEMLQGGKSVAWRDSPNYCYDHGTGYIRRKRAPKPEPALVRCDCGHYVEPVLKMNASRGSSCPDCYDRMSD